MTSSPAECEQYQHDICLSRVWAGGTAASGAFVRSRVEDADLE